MSLNGTRLATAISTALKAQIISQFSSYWSGLKPAELADLNTALTKLCDSIGNGDGPQTTSEIDVNAALVISPNMFTVLPGTFTTPSGAVTGLGENGSINLTGVID